MGILTNWFARRVAAKQPCSELKGMAPTPQSQMPVISDLHECPVRRPEGWYPMSGGAPLRPLSEGISGGGLCEPVRITDIAMLDGLALVRNDPRLAAEYAFIPGLLLVPEDCYHSPSQSVWGSSMEDGYNQHGTHAGRLVARRILEQVGYDSVHRARHAASGYCIEPRKTICPRCGGVEAYTQQLLARSRTGSTAIEYRLECTQQRSGCAMWIRRASDGAMVALAGGTRRPLQLTAGHHNFRIQAVPSSFSLEVNMPDVEHDSDLRPAHLRSLPSGDCPGQHRPS